MSDIESMTQAEFDKLVELSEKKNKILAQKFKEYKEITKNRDKMTSLEISNKLKERNLFQGKLQLDLNQ